MREIILSSDGPCYMYLVPDEVAENLEEYCIEFCDVWLRKSPDAEKYRIGRGVCYSVRDFIDYLNKYIFPYRKSFLIKELGAINRGKKLPPKYRDYPYFSF